MSARFLPPSRSPLPRSSAWSPVPAVGWGYGTGLFDHQVALLVRGCARVSIAVLTMYDGSHAYGKETLRGLFGRLLNRLPTGAERRVEVRARPGSRVPHLTRSDCCNAMPPEVFTFGHLRGVLLTSTVLTTAQALGDHALVWFSVSSASSRWMPICSSRARSSRMRRSLSIQRWVCWAWCSVR